MGTELNPFRIHFNYPIRLALPAVFLLSQQDEVIPPEHTSRIVKLMASRFERLQIDECTHNSARPRAVVEKVFEMVGRMGKRRERGDRGERGGRGRIGEGEEEVGRGESERKRGIYVTTPSRELRDTSGKDPISSRKCCRSPLQLRPPSPRPKTNYPSPTPRKSYIALESSSSPEKYTNKNLKPKSSTYPNPPSADP
jgi:hypothetical protein